MAHIEEVKQNPISGQRIATKIEFHGGNIELGEGILTISSILKDDKGNRINGTDRTDNIVLVDLLGIDQDLFIDIDRNMRILCDKVWGITIQ